MEGRKGKARKEEKWHNMCWRVSWMVFEGGVKTNRRKEEKWHKMAGEMVGVIGKERRGR